MKSWFVGFSLGVFLALLVGASLVWLYRVEIVSAVSNLYGQRVVGETKILLRDGVLYQDGKEIGNLRRGTRLIHRLQTESLEEFYLPIGWENKGGMAETFGRSENERPFVVLE